MTYWTLNAIFLVPVTVVAIVAEVGSRRRARSAVAGAGPGAGAATLSWWAVTLSAVILLLLTAVFDNLMIRLGFFGYNPDWISGVFVGVAPLEDFAYPLAAVVLLPALWTLFTPSATSAPAERSHP
ncbi:lycopene cyclase domain-containing protein [Arthrobacter sp. 260]|uniref:lycopene cyclase domain-containing protein n=1 Tax=Arthrobacter sp. 260 TaxID=2735314 RepID=UPI001491A33C|nr:lycopene cyclase domain-containing protein [Arthrobacter sp. 260]